MSASPPSLDELLTRIGATSSAYGTINDAAYVCLRDLDRVGAAAVGPLIDLIDRNTDIWFDALPPLFWLVERAAAEARGLFLRNLGRGDRRGLCIRGLLRASAAAEVLPLLRDPSSAVRLGAAYTLACAPEVAATEALREALGDEGAGEAALALRLALLRRGVRASMPEGAFAFGGADTPAHSAWSRIAWLRDGAIREVAASFEEDDDARLDAALAARVGSGPASLGLSVSGRWRSGLPLSEDAVRGIDTLLSMKARHGADTAPVELLLRCVRPRLDAATAEVLGARIPYIDAGGWANAGWLDAEGARLEKGGSKLVYARLNMLYGTDRPEAVQWLMHGLQSLVFNGYRHSLWRSAGPLAGVQPATERLDVLPDHGFSASGERTLSRGALAVTVRLGEGGEVLFVDAKGKLRKSLPKTAGASAQDVEAVTVEHKELRRMVEHTWAIARASFESAMIAGRRFSADAWRARFVEHPIGAAIGASLIFMTEDGRSFWTGEGAPRGLGAAEVVVDGPVRIAHPVDLSGDAIEGWRAKLGAIEAPFAQLARAVHSPTLPAIVPGPYDVGRLLARLRERGYFCGRSAPRTYHCRHVGPYFMLVIEHAPLPWNQSGGELEVFEARVRRDELDVPIEAAPRSLVSELREDLALLGIETR